MTDPPQTETANDAIAALLGALGITQVVFVDDLFAKNVDFADVQAAQLSLAPEKVLELVGDPNLKLPDDADVRRQVFERFCEELDKSKKEEIGQRLLAAAGSTDSVRPQDGEAAKVLQEIVGEAKLLTLSPSEWAKRQADIIASAKEGRALLLFDQDLSDDGGSEAGGMTLIASVLASENSESIMCGLLSHTVTIENETSAWKALAAEHNVDLDRFLVVAKENLTTDRLQFARMLKLVALTPDCRRVKDKIQAILTDATTRAAEHITALDVFEFEHIVLRIAHAEGVGEQEMLFRLFAIFQRTESRTLCSADVELKALLSRLRGISLVPATPESAPRLRTWKLQQREMYDDSDHINKLHLPIEIGDIFAKTDPAGSIKQFILLGQPCDLMVRRNGERSPKIGEVLLGEINLVASPTGYDELIPYFGEEPDKRHYVRLKRVHSVPIAVLDLCVFNTDGVSRLAADPPDELHPAWKARHSVLKGELDALLGEYDQFFSADKVDKKHLPALVKNLFERFPPLVGKGGLFKAKCELVGGARSIEFNCVRKRRLHRPRAAALALSYASCFSRPAFDRDLGDEIKF